MTNTTAPDRLADLTAERARLALAAERGEDGAPKALAAVETKIRNAERDAERAELAAREAARQRAEQAAAEADELVAQAAARVAAAAPVRLDLAARIATLADDLGDAVTEWVDLSRRMAADAHRAGVANHAAYSRRASVEDFIAARIARALGPAGSTTVAGRVPPFVDAEARLLSPFLPDDPEGAA